MGSVVRVQCAKTCGACDSNLEAEPKETAQEAPVEEATPAPAPSKGSKLAQHNAVNLAHGISQVVDGSIKAGVEDLVKSVGAVVNQTAAKEEKAEDKAVPKAELSVEQAEALLAGKP